MKRGIALVIMVCMLAMTLTGCREAEKVNYNISKQADYFQSERRVTVYNARTDTKIFELEGYIALDNNEENELIVTAKVGDGSYKKNYIYLNEYTMYVVEDITGTHTDPYHYKIYWHTEVLPDIEIKP